MSQSYVFVSADHRRHRVHDLFKLVFGVWKTKEKTAVNAFARDPPDREKRSGKKKTETDCGDAGTSVLGIREKTLEMCHQVVVGDFAAVHDHEIAYGFQTQLVRDGHSCPDDDGITVVPKRNTRVGKRNRKRKSRTK